MPTFRVLLTVPDLLFFKDSGSADTHEQYVRYVILPIKTCLCWHNEQVAHVNEHQVHSISKQYSHNINNQDNTNSQEITQCSV